MAGPSPRTDALPPAASDKALSTPVIGAPSSVLSPAVNYVGFSVGTVDDIDTPGYAARSVKSRAARNSKPSSRADSVAAQHLVEQEDEALKRKLTIRAAAGRKSAATAGAVDP